MIVLFLAVYNHNKLPSDFEIPIFLANDFHCVTADEFAVFPGFYAGDAWQRKVLGQEQR